MIARTKSYAFTVILLPVFPLEPTFWPAQLMFCICGFQNRNRVAQNDGFIGEYCGEYFLWRWHENDVTFSFGCYYTVTFSLYVILLTEDCRKTWSFQYQNLVFSFLTYAIILLFPPIYMVIYVYMYIYVNLFFNIFCSKLSRFKRSWNCPFLKHFVPSM